MHHHERPRRPGQGDVQRAETLVAGRDQRRLDDHDMIELEPFGPPRRQHRHTVPQASRLDLYSTAIHYLQRCLVASTPDESHLRKAYALLISALGQAERHDEAWQFCQQGLNLYPTDKELLFRAAMLHHHFGRLRDKEG